MYNTSYDLVQNWMRVWLCLIALVHWAGVVLALVSMSETKQELLLLAAASNDNVLRLSTDHYHRLIASPDRDYAILALLTVTDTQYNCEPCRTFDPAYARVAYSYRDVESRFTDEQRTATPTLFFAHLEYTDAKDVFAQLKISQVPALFFHYPTQGPRASLAEADAYDFNRDGLLADAFVRFIQQRMGLDIPLREPIDVAAILRKMLLGLAIGSGLIAASPVIYRVLSHRRIWSALSIGVILLMTTGYMWTRIRHPEFMGRGDGGKPLWMSGGFQYQFGIETQIMSGLYALCALAVVLLVTEVPRMKRTVLQHILAYTAMALFVIGFSVILFIFRQKNTSYPFKLIL